MNNHIPLPNKIYFTQDEKFKSQVVIEPLYPGYGVTIGNALRRVLLSSLPGSAIVAVKIKGVDHEFSTIQGVKEDVVDIILNLKQLRLKVNTDEPVRLKLTVKGERPVKGSDIKSDSRVEIISTDKVIANLDSKNSEFSMELVAQHGRGYVPVEMREGEKLEIGMIAVDAIFTPVRNVNFEVENVRVGQITNYDKLTISMETDGTISGREAMDIASQILVDHFTLLKTNQAEELESAPSTDTIMEDTPKPVEASDDLKSLGFSNRAYNALIRNGIQTPEDLRKLTRQDLENFQGLGNKSIDEIAKILEQ